MGSVNDISSFVKSFATMRSFEAKRIQDREKLIQDIEYLSGYKLETLKDKFAAGWALTPPVKYETTLEDLVKEWHGQLYGRKE